MSGTTSTTVWLGWRWPEATSVSAPVGVGWREHYAAHASFPRPRRGTPVKGSGVLIVDVADFPAVQAVHGYVGDWIVIAVVPDQSGRGEDYEVRLQTEARIYGGLRDLELAVVANDDGPRTVFIVDVPGHDPSPEAVGRMAEAVVDLKAAWDLPVRGPAGRWPSVCRLLNLTGAADGNAAWQRYLAPADGSAAEPGATIVAAEARGPSSSNQFFRAGDSWLAIGRPHRLADFPAARIFFQSAQVVFGSGGGAWPEPGDPDDKGSLQFLEALRPPADPARGPEAYLDDLAGRGRVRPEPDGELPAYVNRWLGRVPREGGG